MRLPVALAAALLTAATFSTIQAQPAHAAPGTPAAPAVVFTEDFENNQGATPILLPQYTNTAGQSYTADPAWLSNCNGVVISLLHPTATPPNHLCDTAWSRVRPMAGDLAQFAGTNPATNHAIGAYTQGDPGPNKVQFETTQPIPLSATNRFLTFSVDTGEQNCFALHALLGFYLLDGATEIPTFTTPIETCAHPSAVINGTYVGTFTSDKPVLFSGSGVGIRLRNFQPSGNGNDAVFDNIRILDVTPQLDQTFSASPVEINSPATLTYTITNTTDLAVKENWSFFGALPAGVTASGASTTDCAAATATANPGATAVSVEGTLATGQTSCTVTVPVTATRAGTYTTCAADITQHVGVNLPGCTSITFTPPALKFDAHAHGGKISGPLVTVSPLAPSDLTCTVTPGSDADTLATANLGGIGNLGVITTSATGTVDGDGLRTSTAKAKTAGVSLLGGLVTADSLEAVASATDDSAGVVTATGSTTVANLRVAGTTILNPTVNQTITIPLVATVVVNERVPHPGGITVNALHVKLLTGTDLVVSHARTTLGC